MLQIAVDDNTGVVSHDRDVVVQCAHGGASEVGTDGVTCLDGLDIGVKVLDNGRMIYGSCRRFRRVSDCSLF